MRSNKKSDMLRALQTLSRQRNENKKTNAHREHFKPLSVWEKLGYDVERIERLTPDHLKEMHPVLGMTYAIEEHIKTAEDSKSVTNDNRDSELIKLAG